MNFGQKVRAIVYYLFSCLSSTCILHKSFSAFYAKHGFIPAADQVLDALQVTEEHLEKAENSQQKEIFVWYFNEYLVGVLGKQHWSKEHRMMIYPTSRVEMADGDSRVLLTRTVEAFGLVMLDNCHEKWKNMIEYKKQHGESADLPKGKVDGKPFRGKYSDAFNGQKKYGGWTEEGLERFSVIMGEVKAWRMQEDLVNSVYGYMRKIMIEMHKPKPKKKKASADGDGSGTEEEEEERPETAKERKIRLAKERYDRAHKKRKITRESE